MGSAQSCAVRSAPVYLPLPRARDSGLPARRPLPPLPCSRVVRRPGQDICSQFSASRCCKRRRRADRPAACRSQEEDASREENAELLGIWTAVMLMTGSGSWLAAQRTPDRRLDSAEEGWNLHQKCGACSRLPTGRQNLCVGVIIGFFGD
jgi:hypothetical protein